MDFSPGEHFVTLFDSLYLPQGLALIASMQRNVPLYTLWILCVDHETYEVLSSLELENVRLLNLKLLENDELLHVKSKRTKGEYCWTLTPFSIRFVFEADSTVNRVTYIDADLWFRKDPLPIFVEFDQSEKSVLITDHSYTAVNDQSTTSGQFCVQFMTFTRDSGEEVRMWWERRCLEWCYARQELGLFGDQKYLDKWPEMFSDKVHILNNNELILAPWSATRYPYGHCVFYHFHCLRIVASDEVLVGDYFLPDALVENVYRPYLDDIRSSLSALASLGIPFKPQTARLGTAHAYFRCIKRIYKHLKMYFRPERLSISL